MIYTNDQLTVEDAEPHSGDVRFLKWTPHLEEALEKNGPFDIVVVDFFAFVGTTACENLGIKHVINYPGPLQAFSFFGVFVPGAGNMSNCCGAICIRPTLK